MDPAGHEERRRHQQRRDGCWFEPPTLDREHDDRQQDQRRPDGHQPCADAGGRLRQRPRRTRVRDVVDDPKLSQRRVRDDDDGCDEGDRSKHATAAVRRGDNEQTQCPEGKTREWTTLEHETGHCLKAAEDRDPGHDRRQTDEAEPESGSRDGNRPGEAGDVGPRGRDDCGSVHLGLSCPDVQATPEGGRPSVVSST